MEFPQQLRYTEDHEWVEYDPKTKIAKIGITEYAQEKLGDVVHVELPREGLDVKAAESFGSVESVKAVSDIYTPVGGKVIEINTSLEDSPELVNEDPYGEAWMIAVQVSDEGSFSKLMTATQYEEFVESDED
jgi:glycine cleavage system H protein